MPSEYLPAVRSGEAFRLASRTHFLGISEKGVLPGRKLCQARRRRPHVTAGVLDIAPSRMDGHAEPSLEGIGENPAGLRGLQDGDVGDATAARVGADRHAQASTPESKNLTR